MECCPLCGSCAVLDVAKPCIWCGLSLLETRQQKKVAVVPGWFLFDGSTTELLTRPLSRVLKIADSLILDFSEVTLLDSDDLTDLTSLVLSTKQTGRNVAFIKVGPSLRETLVASQNDTVFTIVATVDEAVASFEN